MDFTRASKKIGAGKYEGRTYLDVAAGDPKYVERQMARLAGTEVEKTWIISLHLAEITNHTPTFPLDRPIPESGERVCQECLTSSDNWRYYRARTYCHKCLVEIPQLRKDLIESLSIEGNK